MRAMRSILLTLLGLALSPLHAADSADSKTSPVKLASSINAIDFARFERTLSSDEFGGRKPGTPGAKLTLDFLVAEFERMGLKPGNAGSWFQTVPVDSTLLVNDDVKLDVRNGEVITTTTS